MTSPLLKIEDLTCKFTAEDADEVIAVDRFSLVLNKGETIGIVGESGCGKSTVALSIMRLLPHPVGRITRGSIFFANQDLLKISAEQMSHVRGAQISMIFQEPAKALNPVHSIGRQLGEILMLHENMTANDALIRAIELLRHVGISAPEVRVKEFPHQLSGGMRQRVMIAIAIACNPSLIIADEPTTALDVTVQAQVLNLLDEIQREYASSILMITHDFGVIAETCDRVIVMYAGQVIESGPIATVLDEPLHPYTQGLIASIPRLENAPKTRLPTIPGKVPLLTEISGGCRFQNRCSKVMPMCKTQMPALKSAEKEREVRCFAVID